jgi:calpain-7
MLRSVLNPYDAASDSPIMSKNGKYVVKLNFNGCYRRVVIDDRLPTSSTSRIIHVVDRRNPGLLWPALIEKAYLKVRGGYDFPGSNSGTDIWILSGWIPEQVFLQSEELEPDRLWQRISNSFAYGDVLVTMGTGKMSCKTEREIGLAGEHDYSVLDIKEVEGQRLFLIKNPWCEGPSWRGKLKGQRKQNGSSSPTTTANDEELLIDLDGSNEPVQNSRDLLNADDQLSPGTFWMDMDNVLQYFESIYLNWNPGLFAYRQDMHFAWDLTPSESGMSRPRGTCASLYHHPQYTISATQGGPVWVVLCRHFQNAVPADATDDEIAKDRYGIELSGHISLLALRSNGRRVLLPDKAVEKAWYVDSPQTLLKLECEPDETMTLVPAEQELPAIRHTFTIFAFSNSPITLAEASQRYQYARTYSGSWTKETAGGNAHSPRYSTNPQFSLAVPRRTSISILLESVKDTLNVHFKLVHSDGKRIHSIRNRDIVFDSKDYRRGCCTAEHPDLAPGQYTIICSTFESQQLGDFTLLVETNEPAQAILLPREGAGRMRLELSNVAFKAGQSKVAAPLVPYRLVKMYAIARHFDDGGAGSAGQRSHSQRSLIRMSIEIGRGPERRILVASNGGEYSDNAGGIRTEDIDLKPDHRRYGEIWIVLDRMYVNAEDREERISVEMFVDQPGAVECGVWREWD